MPASKPVLVVGSLNMDQVVRVPRLPVMGETLLGASSITFVPGGKGANQAVAMARLGASVQMAGRIGQDPFGQQLKAALQDDQIDTSLLVTDTEAASGSAFIFLNAEGDNAIVVSSGANAHVGKDQQQMEHIFAALAQAQALVLQLEIPHDTVELLIDRAHSLHVPVILNLAPAYPLRKETLSKLSVLVVNETEASLLSGQPVESLEDARHVGAILHEHGIPTVVITLGAQGAILINSDAQGQTNIIYQEAPEVTVVDTTAAGDCFVGALTVALTEGQSPSDALRFATRASAIKVTRFGAQSGLPRRADIR
ncbi:ribokinase [Dictyobacter formicarum]|uniref:Ribokinase n=1 Tax=Dictyobacter formicarum TaxID=2778368 RepID=A0ABQ3VNZ5_9CHLR|nr:ribokinase [Dictyobacter formicarum]GHO87308.1 ribokinase [Dictyobacter formicarum]